VSGNGAMVKLTKVFDLISPTSVQTIDTLVRRFYDSNLLIRAFTDGASARLKQCLLDFFRSRGHAAKRGIGAPVEPAPSGLSRFPTFQKWTVGEHRLFVPLASAPQALVAEAGATENETGPGLAKACSMRATVWDVVLGNRRRQTIALLWEAANAKLADRRHSAILGGALLVLALATAGGIVFLTDERAANSREVPTVSAIGSLPLAGDAPTTTITRTAAVRAAVEDRLSKITSAGVTWKREQGALVEYYSIPAKPLLWVDENGITDRAKSVLKEIARADDYGLRAIDYQLPNPDSFDPDDRTAIDWLADAEVEISFAVLRYAHDARGGRIKPSRLSKNLSPALSLPEPLDVLDKIAVERDPAFFLRGFQPSHPQFELLRQKLLEIKGESDPSKPSIVIPDGAVLKKGIEHEHVALLRKRLKVSSNGGNESLYDDAVDEAVRTFQKLHGVVPDGLVGAGTRRLLNQETHEQAYLVKQRLILLNMERWRWLPYDLGPFYVNVNVPEFMARVVKEGRVVHATRVVVGKPDTQTPIFSDEMQEIVFGPYWNVPTSIKVEEIRPYLKEETAWLFGGWNTSVFQRHGLRIRYGGREVDPGTIDWDRVDIRSLEIFQPPGPDNVLGRVKFVFPNKHDVYMHDTTQKELFAKLVRAESHGCVRVQNPDALAAILLDYDQGWSAARVESAIQYGYDQHVALSRKIPVHITYFTLWVNDDGSMSTFGDLYGHDARLAAALFGDSVGFQSPNSANNKFRDTPVSRGDQVPWDGAASDNIVDGIIRLLQN
jgi:murein L,D-transpeptidase YcbB/YkuD